MVEAILFDFDGTLIDTNELIFESYNHAFKKVFNRNIRRDEFLKLYGRPLRSSLIEEYGEYGENLTEVYRIFNAENHDRLVKSFPDTKEGLALFKEKGYKLGIVTSKRLHMVLRGTKFLGYDGMFEVIITPDDTEKHKPDPEPILLGCEKLKSDPVNTLYVGDSVFDIIAGQAAGLKTCAVKYSLTAENELLNYNPTYFVDSVSELSKIILKEKCDE